MKTISIIFALFLIQSILISAPITVGLLQHDNGSEDNGYILFAPNNTTRTYLIDKCGYVINKWYSEYKPGFAAKLDDEGNLIRAANLANPAFVSGGSGGMLEKYDWQGNKIWQYRLSTDKYCMHHDFEIMPNGNILAICWEKIFANEAILLGRTSDNTPDFVWNDKIIEIRPVGTDSAEIVWEWSAWDHLVQDVDPTKPNYSNISHKPELIDINYVTMNSRIDWLHLNSVDYNPEFDQVLISSPNFGEIWIIDHSTSTKEAKTHKGGRYGKGGDLLYRWGNPASYKSGEPQEQVFFFQHDAHWIPKGYPNENSILVFNNQHFKNTSPYSSVDILEPAVDNNGIYNQSIPSKPDSLKWTYTSKAYTDFYSPNLGSAQILPNGNILVCSGSVGIFFEIDSTKKDVWYYVNPATIFGITQQGESPKLANQVYKCHLYFMDHPRFNNKDVTRKGLIENENRLSENCQLDFSVVKDENPDIIIFPNPSKDKIYVGANINVIKAEIYNLNSEKICEVFNSNEIDISKLLNGSYIIQIYNTNGATYSKMFIIKK